MNNDLPPDGFEENKQDVPPDGFEHEDQSVTEVKDSTFDRINHSFPGVRRGIENAIDTLNAPFELAGEATTMALGGGQWQAPTIAQRYPMLKNIGNALLPKPLEMQSGQKPVAAYELPRRILKGATAAVTNASQGLEAARHAGTQAYFSDQPLDVATDIGFGVAMPKVTSAPFEATQQIGEQFVQPLFNKAKTGVKYGASSLFGPKVADIEARLNNPEALRAARSPEQIAEQFPEEVKKLSKMAYESKGEALKTLQGAIPKQKVLDVFDYVKRKIGAATTPDKEQAINLIDDLRSRIDSGEEVMSQVQVERLIKDYDKSINWMKNSKETNNSFQRLRTGIDHVLKGENQGYKEAMIPVAKQTRLLKQVEKEFGVKSVPGMGYTEGTTTAGKIKNVLSDKNAVRRRMLEELKTYTGKDIPSEVEAYGHQQAFSPGVDRSRGSRRTLLGTVVGGAVGKFFGYPIIGGTVGAQAGALADTHGAATLGKLIDAYNLVRKSAPTMTIQEFLPIAEEQLMTKYGISLKSVLPSMEASYGRDNKGPAPLFRNATLQSS